MIKNIRTTCRWIKEDWHSHPFRFAIEFLAWILSISCSLIMAFTVPDPPLLILYPLWISGCVLYAWAAWSRRSFGMLANYMLLVTSDSIGLLRIALF
ncbi:MAG: hypothetical protein ACR2HF_08305 [Methylococcaceae bacterium]